MRVLSHIASSNNNNDEAVYLVLLKMDCDMEKKAKRAKNFTETEKEMLIDICCSFKNIIENKKTDGTTVKEKNRAWEEIRSIFNASSETGERTVKQLHALYDTMKKTVRKDNHDDRVEKYKTGGGIYCPKVTGTGTKLLALLAPQFQPLATPYDSSATYYGNETDAAAPEEQDIMLLPESQEAEILLDPGASSPPPPPPPPSSSSPPAASPLTGDFHSTENKRLKRKFTNAAANTLLDTIRERKKSKSQLDLESHQKKMQILEEELKLKEEVTRRTVKLLETEQQIKDLELKMKLIQYSRMQQC